MSPRDDRCSGRDSRADHHHRRPVQVLGPVAAGEHAHRRAIPPGLRVHLVHGARLAHPHVRAFGQQRLGRGPPAGAVADDDGTPAGHPVAAHPVPPRARKSA